MPSCNYNIILSRDDLKQLLETGYISKDPSRVESTFCNECGECSKVNNHRLVYSNDNVKSHIQFIGIGIKT